MQSDFHITTPSRHSPQSQREGLRELAPRAERRCRCDRISMPRLARSVTIWDTASVVSRGPIQQSEGPTERTQPGGHKFDSQLVAYRSRREVFRIDRCTPTRRTKIDPLESK